MEIAGIGGLILLSKLFCEKNVLVMDIVGIGGLNFSKDFLMNFFCYGP